MGQDVNDFLLDLEYENSIKAEEKIKNTEFIQARMDDIKSLKGFIDSRINKNNYKKEIEEYTYSIFDIVQTQHIATVKILNNLLDVIGEITGDKDDILKMKKDMGLI